MSSPNITHDINKLNFSITIANEMKQKWLIVWVSMLVALAIISVAVFYLLLLSFKIKQRVFFVVMGLIVLVVAIVGEEAIREFYNLLITVSSFPVVTTSNISCFSTSPPNATVCTGITSKVTKFRREEITSYTMFIMYIIFGLLFYLLFGAKYWRLSIKI